MADGFASETMPEIVSGPAAPLADQGPRLYGVFDLARPDRVAGWAIDRADAAASVAVEILREGVPVATVRADAALDEVGAVATTASRSRSTRRWSRGSNSPSPPSPAPPLGPEVERLTALVDRVETLQHRLEAALSKAPEAEGTGRDLRGILRVTLAIALGALGTGLYSLFG